MHSIVRSTLLSKYQFDGYVEYEGRHISCVHPVSWYDNENAFELDIHRKKVGKIEAFKELHQYIVEMTSSGVISRQEVVSMIPPLLLNVDPNDVVLDMCAAPGSKTLQLLERVHGHDGVVIANDADSRRSYMLVNQTSHIVSHNIIITNHLGQLFPSLQPIDKILCDVPCSGDGTLVCIFISLCLTSSASPPNFGRSGMSTTLFPFILSRLVLPCERLPFFEWEVE